MNFKNKILIIAFIMSLQCFTIMAKNSHSISSGAGVLPKPWYITCLYSFFKVPHYFYTQFKIMNFKRLFQKEYKTGVVSHDLTQSFYALDEQSAQEMGQHLVAMRQKLYRQRQCKH